MSLTNSQYDSIRMKYDRTRLSNLHRENERREQVYSSVPGFKDLDDEIIQTSLDCAKRKLSGDSEALENLHDKLAKLKAKKASLLSESGFPADYLDPIYTCPDCKDTGYIGSSTCHCFIKQVTEFLYDQSNIRDYLSENNFSTLSFDYYEGEDLMRFKRAVDASHALVDNFENEKTNILFFGTVGTGKSFLSGCIAHDLIEKGYSCIYFSAINLFEQISKYTFNSSSKEELYNLHDYLYNCDCLIIDDLGTENSNSFVASQLFSLINERNLRKRSTIISTNLSLEDIRDRYTDRILSRTVSSFNVFRLSGKDIRIQKRAQDRK